MTLCIECVSREVYTCLIYYERVIILCRYGVHWWPDIGIGSYRFVLGQADEELQYTLDGHWTVWVGFLAAINVGRLDVLIAVVECFDIVVRT